MIVGGWIALLAGAYCLNVDLNLNAIGIETDSTGGNALVWIGASLSVGSLTVAFCRHQREIQEWRDLHEHPTATGKPLPRIKL